MFNEFEKYCELGDVHEIEDQTFNLKRGDKTVKEVLLKQIMEYEIGYLRSNLKLVERSSFHIIKVLLK